MNLQPQNDVQNDSVFAKYIFFHVIDVNPKVIYEVNYKEQGTKMIP